MHLVVVVVVVVVSIMKIRGILGKNSYAYRLYINGGVLLKY